MVLAGKRGARSCFACGMEPHSGLHSRPRHRGECGEQEGVQGLWLVGDSSLLGTFTGLVGVGVGSTLVACGAGRLVIWGIVA